MVSASHTFAATKKPAKGTNSSIYVAPTYLKSKNSVRVTFSGLKNVSKVTYTLSYNGNGVGQGVVGSFTPSNKNVITRDMYLGTCSGKVCIKHKNIKNIQIQVTTTYKNKSQTTKSQNIKS